MKSKKYFAVGLVVGITISLTCGAFAYQIKEAYSNEFPIVVNGKQVKMEGYNVDNYSYFKLRDIAKYTGFEVDFKDGEILINTTNINNATTMDDTIWCPVAELNQGLSNIKLSIEENDNGYYVQVINKNSGEILIESLDFQIIDDRIFIDKSIYETIVLPFDQ